MNFDTRTVLDLVILDPDLEIVLISLIEGERFLWYTGEKTSQNDFISFAIPAIKDELNFYMKTKLHEAKLNFLKKLIDLDKVDYYQLIPAISKI